MSRVLVVQRRMTHYRVPFFERLREAMAERSLELVVAYGEGTADERTKQDDGDLPWGHRLETRYAWGDRLCWQPFDALRRRADLVVVTAENKLLANLPLQWLAPQRVALWGHGGNLQGDAGSLRERFKRRQAAQADWWFAYTDRSVPLIGASGFPRERITVLDNAIDTSALSRQLASIDAAAAARARRRWQLDDSGPVGLYLGSLYADKRLDLVLQAADALHRRVAGFQLLVVGDGPERSRVEQFCATRPWAQATGSLRGADKAAALAIASVMLNPGLVGLGVLDSFVAAVPMVTTRGGKHSPEIAYLADGENGLVTADDATSFVDAVHAVLTDDPLGARLRAGCRRAASRYTLDHMVDRFVEGARGALAAPPYRRAAVSRAAA